MTERDSSNTNAFKDRSRRLARESYWETHDRKSYECPDCGRSENEAKGTFEVQHKNGETLDNRPENRVALCRSCHKKIEHVTRLLEKHERNPLKAAHLEVAKRKRPELPGGVAEEMVARARYEWANSESE